MAVLAGCGAPGGGGSPSTTANEESTDRTAEVGAEPRGVVFNTGSGDVTLFDPASNEVTGDRPVNAAVRWLSNEQRYFDGESIWTYDYPDEEVEAIAINPETFEVVERVPTGGAGPGHSFVLTPDSRRGFVNVAGDDFLAVVDPRAGEVVGQIETGAYP